MFVGVCVCVGFGSSVCYRLSLRCCECNHSNTLLFAIG